MDQTMSVSVLAEHILRQSCGGGNVERVRMESLKSKLKVVINRIDKWMIVNRLKLTLEER